MWNSLLELTWSFFFHAAVKQAQDWNALEAGILGFLILAGVAALALLVLYLHCRTTRLLQSRYVKDKGHHYPNRAFEE